MDASKGCLLYFYIPKERNEFLHQTQRVMCLLENPLSLLREENWVSEIKFCYFTKFVFKLSKTKVKEITANTKPNRIASLSLSGR